MRLWVMAVAAAFCLATEAAGGDKPSFGPVPSWVRPVASPVGPPPEDERPISILLSDQQSFLQPGKATNYLDMAMRIETPQGLQAGNLSFAWRPENDDVVVHKALIRRGDDVIDILASGQDFTILRRETNLERATLDGVLTANLQPEGLEVGDIVEFALSVTSASAVMGDHVETSAGAWNTIPISRAHLRVQWPSGMKVRHRQRGALPAAKIQTADGVTSLELSVDDLEPAPPPRFAPRRYALGRLVEATDFAAWNDLSAMMAPLYEKAAVIAPAGPLRAELDRIRAASADPVARTEAALALVQDRIRYVALAIGPGALTPADAETTWSRRYGDCKGKTALLLALLRELGVRAEPALVNTVAGDGLNERLPTVGAFNHVLVRAEIGKKTYWLDGTRTGDTALARLRTPDFAWALPVRAKDADLTRLAQAPLATPDEHARIHIDASAGIFAPAPAKAELRWNGDYAQQMRLGLSGLTREARDRALRDFWKDRYDFAEVKSVDAVFDPATGEQALIAEGTMKLDWSNGFHAVLGSELGAKVDFSRDPGPDSDAPIAVDHAFYQSSMTTIALPKGFRSSVTALPPDVSETTGGVEYRRTVRFADDVLRVETSERSLVEEFPYKDAAAVQAALKVLSDRVVALRRPASYRPTAADMAAMMETTPSTVSALMERGKLLLDQRRYDDALADFDRAQALNPADVSPAAHAALAAAWKRDFARAEKALAAATALDPRNVVVMRAHGLLAEQKGDHAAAVAAYTAALEAHPADGFSLEHRSRARSETKDLDGALADLTAILRAAPQSAAAHANRALVLEKQRKFDEASKDAAAAIGIAPDDASFRLIAGRIVLAAGQTEEAFKAFSEAIRLSPSALAYAARSSARRAGDRTGQIADLDAAIRLDPKYAWGVRRKAFLQGAAGDHAGAMATIAAGLAAQPGESSLLSARAYSRSDVGDLDGALADWALAIEARPTDEAAYAARADILLRQGKGEDALKEAVAVVAAMPASVSARLTAGGIYRAAGRAAEAMRVTEEAVALEPSPRAYTVRGNIRPDEDVAGKMADYEQALGIDPRYGPAIAAKAALQNRQGDPASAVMTYSAALADAPDDLDLIVGRGVMRVKAGQTAGAEEDFAKARTLASTASSLNTICWIKATNGAALESALRDCDDALTKEPENQAILDSRALVLLQLKRHAEAEAAFSRLLAANKGSVGALYGRGLARLGLSQTEQGAADVALAASRDARVVKTFRNYGLAP